MTLKFVEFNTLNGTNELVLILL